MLKGQHLQMLLSLQQRHVIQLKAIQVELIRMSFPLCWPAVAHPGVDELGHFREDDVAFLLYFLQIALLRQVLIAFVLLVRYQIVQILFLSSLLASIKRLRLCPPHGNFILVWCFCHIFPGFVEESGRWLMIMFRHLNINDYTMEWVVKVRIQGLVYHQLLDNLLMRVFCSASTLVRLSYQTVCLSSSAFFSLRRLLSSIILRFLFSLSLSHLFLSPSALSFSFQICTAKSSRHSVREDIVSSMVMTLVINSMERPLRWSDYLNFSGSSTRMLFSSSKVIESFSAIGSYLNFYENMIKQRVNLSF